jgi:hypothetical protein
VPVTGYGQVQIRSLRLKQPLGAKSFVFHYVQMPYSLFPTLYSLFPIPYPLSLIPIPYSLCPSVSTLAILSKVNTIAFKSLISSKTIVFPCLINVNLDLDLDLDLDLNSSLDLDLDLNSCINLKNTGLDLATALTKPLVFPCLIELVRL